MSKNREQLRVLLLQIRDGGQVREEELNSFAEYCGLQLNQIDVLNVFDTPTFSDRDADEYDALLVGGASEANVLLPEEFPFVTDCQRLLARCAETNKPVFASCFGFQLAVLALGGEIKHRETDFEMGTVPISLEYSVWQDPIFRDTPDGFFAVSVHKQYADKLPENCVSLAYTEQCIHAFRVKDKPFWAFQFHPEVDKRILVERLTFYKDKYTDGDDHLDNVLANAQETPQSNALMGKFVDRILVDQEHLLD
ncbi:type 1 glutamine amidotransferase [Neptuniibacter caesariensis]|uniref:Putative amino transferase n=1 Tax=Neptuniibacter caesariensis TaxID=207954 RepID=A0A7U8C4M6_NEPCE|nr:gamma-glutamyl-gamma-aminobutyrate hydrolase family protein [Neptuniibacter caesariensis]EAR61373.1 putative amino transferase [Oceanospirillum sp. MED92] [Neptuniibacter caesariensis]